MTNIDPTPRAACAKCGTLLRAVHDTNGAGQVLWWVTPCRGCLRAAKAAGVLLERQRQRKAWPQNGTPPSHPPRMVRCTVCLVDLTYRGRGRPPLFCDAHRPPSHRRKESD